MNTFWRMAWQPTPVSCLENPHGQRSLTGYSPWGCRELDTTEQLITNHMDQFSSVAQSCLTLCNPMDCSLSGSSVRGDSPGKNTGVRYHALLQGIVPTQGWNPGLLHFRQILHHLSHQGSPRILKWIAYPFSRGIFPTQESNLDLLHHRQILYKLSDQGSQNYCYWLLTEHLAICLS